MCNLNAYFSSARNNRNYKGINKNIGVIQVSFLLDYIVNQMEHVIDGLRNLARDLLNNFLQANLRVIADVSSSGSCEFLANSGLSEVIRAERRRCFCFRNCATSR